MSRLEEIAIEYGLCSCDEAYISRNLTAPDCPFHAFAISEAMEKYAKECSQASLEKAKTQLVKNADEIKPYAYRTGNWDGKQSDTIIAIDETGKYHIAVYYEGFMDGSAFEDWYDENDYLIEFHITHWMEPDFDKESITQESNIVLL